MVRRLVVCFFIAVLTLSAAVRRHHPADTEFAKPDGIDLIRFPIQPGPLSKAEMNKLGLTEKTLKAPVTVHNHDRALVDCYGRFRLETLMAGTKVLVDEKGVLRYKSICGNRINEVTKCPPATANSATGSTTGNRERSDLLGGKPKTETPTPSLLERFVNASRSAAANIWGSIWNLLKWLWYTFWFLVGLGLILAALMGIAIAIRELWRWLNRDRRQPPPPPAANQLAGQNPPPNPQAPAAPVVQPAPPAAPQPQAAAAAGNPELAVNQPPAQQPAGAFQTNAVLYTPADGTTPRKVQIGRNSGRVQVNVNPDDGSVVIWIHDPAPRR